ncbi:MAG: serine/threonine protein kinase [Sandaracinaceae bacterium]
MSQEAPNLHLVPDPPPEAPDPYIGQTLDGRYHVERVLGKGGMGLVYAAKHVVLQKPLAIKVLKDEVSRDEQVMARFRREAQSASAIGSQHICDVSDFGTMPDGSTYFVMEFLNGPSLSGAIAAMNPMPTQRVLDIGMQLCDALGAAHERGIVHRDLKPDNVHLVAQGTRQDFVKVLDFGIAKVGDNAGKKLTQAGQVFGTPHYMSPEQCAGRDVDHRTDIYALGVMLYEMACGKVPFDADNLMGVLTKHVYEQPIPPRELPPPVAVPPGLEAIILKCLAKQPAERYSTMAELKADLAAVQRGGTPDAVMASVRGSVVPKTQMISSDSIPHLAGVAPAAAPVAEPEEPKSRGGLIVGGVVLLGILGAGAFGAAYYFGGFGDAGTTVATNDPTTTTDTPEDPVADPVGDDGTNEDPVADGTATVEDGEGTEGAGETREETAAPAPVTIRLVSDPTSAEVYTQDGTLLGNTPFTLTRPTGDQAMQVTLRLAGYHERTLSISRLTAATELTVTLSREARGGGGGRHHQTAPVPTPVVQPLAPTTRPPPQPQNNGQGEIINPW